MSDFLADYEFIEGLWLESWQDQPGEARRFAEANREARFVISTLTSIRFMASVGVGDEDMVERVLQAFPVVPFDQAIMGRAASLLRKYDVSLEIAIECAIAQINDLQILTGNASQFSGIPGLRFVDFRDERS